jgi:hypothetical protein
MRHFLLARREREMHLHKMSNPCYNDDLSVADEVGAEIAYRMKVVVRRSNSE